jgi:hypothetical protein
MILFGLVSLVCWIMVLIQMFKVQGALHGILGIICGLYAFIWGWMKATELNLKNVMLVWTGCFVANIVLQIVYVAVVGNQLAAY